MGEKLTCHTTQRTQQTGALQFPARLLNRLPQQDVEFLGAIPQAELPKMMSESHVLVLPSIEDGFGLVLSQALALKTTADVTTVDGGNIAAALR